MLAPRLDEVEVLAGQSPVRPGQSPSRLKPVWWMHKHVLVREGRPRDQPAAPVTNDLLPLRRDPAPAAPPEADRTNLELR
jgi:hypothetical protein